MIPFDYPFFDFCYKGFSKHIADVKSIIYWCWWQSLIFIRQCQSSNLGKKQLVIPLFFKDYPVEESNNLVIIKNSLFDTTADHCNIKMQDNVLDISTNTTNCFIDNKILNNTISFPTVKYITFPLAVTIGPLLDSQSSKRQRSSRSPTPTGSNSLSSLYNYDLTQNYSSTVSNSIQSCSMQFQIRHHHSLPIRSKIMVARLQYTSSSWPKLNCYSIRVQ